MFEPFGLKYTNLSDLPNNEEQIEVHFLRTLTGEMYLQLGATVVTFVFDVIENVKSSDSVSSVVL